MTASPAAPEASLADRLCDVHVGARSEIETSRHVFRGEVSYVLQDPITFQSFSAAPPEYEIFARLDAEKTLGTVFDELARDGVVDPGDEDRFYRYIVSLHQLGFLSLPVSNDAALYRRFEHKRRARRRAMLTSVLFFRVPLVNPDAFLDRTVRLVGALFSRGVFVAWMIAVAACVILVASQWRALAAPLSDLLVLRNLVVMWFLLIGLKVIHEYGHAYACKLFGGHVPEMGAYFILLTPCAYVDASASWGFTSKWRRLVVNFAGVYVESFVAMAALVVWSLTDPSPAHAVAYQVMVLASVTTVGFNVNPLLRFDGYYVLSDLLEIPNLRQRASTLLSALAKRWLIGVRATVPLHAPGMTALLLIFGVAAGGYRMLLLVLIAALLASKFGPAGFLVAALFVSLSLGSMLHRAVRYLLESAEAAPARWRSAVLTAAWVLAVPAVLLVVPLPSSVRADGLVRRETERVVYALEAGFLEDVDVLPGDRVEAGTFVARLGNLDLESAVADSRAAVDAARVRVQAAEIEGDLARAATERERLAFHRRALEQSCARQDGLRIVAPGAGRLVSGPERADTGRYVPAGEPIATIADGAPTITVLVGADDLARTGLRVGRDVECRSRVDPSRVLRGTIATIALRGSREIDEAAMTRQGGGVIATDVMTGAAARPYFAMTVRLDADAADPAVAFGAHAEIRLPAAPEPLARRMLRRVLRFKHGLEAASGVS